MKVEHGAKFVQITTGPSAESLGYEGHQLYALDENGDVFVYWSQGWERKNGWEKLNMTRIPTREKKE